MLKSTSCSHRCVVVEAKKKEKGIQWGTLQSATSAGIRVQQVGHTPGMGSRIREKIVRRDINFESARLTFHRHRQPQESDTDSLEVTAYYSHQDLSHSPVTLQPKGHPA